MNLDKVCFKLGEKLPNRIIYRRGNEPYLTRHYIIRKFVRWLPSVYLHQFHESDEDQELHNHPWLWSLSIILAGSYREERLVGNSIKENILKPGMLNFIRSNDFHRVDLLSNNVWTLFISGPRLQECREKSWGFLNRYTKKFVYWPEHEARKKQLAKSNGTSKLNMNAILHS